MAQSRPRRAAALPSSSRTNSARTCPRRDFEIALFDDQGVVTSLAVLAFQDLPAGKTKVTRFDLSGVDCARLSRVLVNHATQCTGAGVEPATCMRSLQTATKTKIDFGA